MVHRLLYVTTGLAINLIDYLTGTFDATGTWEDVDPTGALTGNTFATSGVAPGIYQFKYLVTNACNVTDDALITLELVDIPNPPSASPVAAVCEGMDVQLSASAVANASYAWTGPGGFTSSAQNPLIASAGMAANGNYSVNVTVNGCTSADAFVPVVVNMVPQFTLEGNAALCEGQTSFLNVVPSNFNSADVDFKWVRDGFELTELSGQLMIIETGLYEVTVFNGDCTTTRMISVVSNDNPFDVTPEAGCDKSEYVLTIANIADIQGAVVTWTGGIIYVYRA